MHLFHKRHAASGQCKESQRQLGKDAGRGIVLGWLPEDESSTGVKFVLLAPGSVAAAKPKPPLCNNRPPNEKAPDHFVYRSTQGWA